MKKIFAIFRTQTIKDSLLVFIGLGVTAVLGFVYTVIMARILAPAQFGVFSALVSLIAITFSLGDLGIGPAIINYLPKHREHGDKIVQTAYWFQCLVGLVAILLFWSLAKFSGLLIPGSTPEQFVLIGSLIFNYILVNFAQSVFTAERQFLKFSISQIIDASTKIILVFVFFRLGELSISTALLANFVSSALALVITFWGYLWKIKTSFDKPIFFHLYEFSKWIAVSRIFSVFISRVDVILLNLLASGFQAGIFAAASRVTMLFALFVSSLGTVINPRFSALESKSEARKYIKKLIILVSFISCFVLLTVYFSDQIISIVFGQSYRSASIVFRLLGLSMIPFLFTVITTGVLLYTFNQSRFYAQITALQVSLIIMIDLLFIPRLGVYAPVLASTVSNLVFLALSILKLHYLFANTELSKQVVLQDTPKGI